MDQPAVTVPGPASASDFMAKDGRGGWEAAEKRERRLSEVYSETGSLGTWPRLSNIGSVSVQTQLRPLVCEATVVSLVSHTNTVDVEAERVSKSPGHQTPSENLLFSTAEVELGQFVSVVRSFLSHTARFCHSSVGGGVEQIKLLAHIRYVDHTRL